MTSYKAMIYFLLKIISETVGLFIDFRSPLETWYINFRRWTFMTENNIKHRTLVKGKKKVKILITLGLCHFLWAASGSIPSSDGITAFAPSLSPIMTSYKNRKINQSTQERNQSEMDNSLSLSLSLSLSIIIVKALRIYYFIIIIIKRFHSFSENLSIEKMQKLRITLS